MSDTKKYIVSIKTICNICLSMDRSLNSLRDLEVPPEWRQLGLNILEGAVCWECKAVMNRYILFKKKIVEAQTFIQSGVEHSKNWCTFSSLSSETLSRFSITSENQTTQIENDALDYPFIEDSLKLDQIKIEIKEANDNNDHEGINAFDTDFEINYSKCEERTSETVEAKKKNNLNINDNKINSKFKNINVIKLTHVKMLEMRDTAKLKPLNKGVLYHCDDCILGFKSQVAYNKHMNKWHTKLMGHNMMCDICKRYFQHKSKLNKHMSQHYILYQCKVCSKLFRKRMVTETHFRKKHGQLLSTKTQLWSCIECNMRFRRESALQKHMSYIHVPVDKRSLHIHMLQHTGTETYKCDICNKEYRSNAVLKSHMYRHKTSCYRLPPDNAYCAECDKQFTSHYRYKLHLKTSINQPKKKMVRGRKPKIDAARVNKIFLKYAATCRNKKISHNNPIFTTIAQELNNEMTPYSLFMRLKRNFNTIFENDDYCTRNKRTLFIGINKVVDISEVGPH